MRQKDKKWANLWLIIKSLFIVIGWVNCKRGIDFNPPLLLKIFQNLQTIIFTFYITTKNIHKVQILSSLFSWHLLRGDGLDDLDLAALVSTALGAHSVGQMQRTALGARNETRNCQLPGGATSLITSCLGYFSLRDCHVDTSLILNKRLPPLLLIGIVL